MRDGLHKAFSAIQILARLSIDILLNDEKSLLIRQKTIIQAVESATQLMERQKTATLSSVQANRKQVTLQNQRHVQQKWYVLLILLLTLHPSLLLLLPLLLLPL